ncbi:MAG: hypothetical protein JWP87_3319 [Labilithrix sp.]|jgi:hypothetical protein|nr:hypothetical protein [Labilithrix sp.]
MKRLIFGAIVGAALAACAAGGPTSGEYCAPSEPAKCTTISFPEKRGTESPGTMQIEGQRYELRWMDTENGRRKYLANPPSGTVALEMSAIDPKTVTVRWRDAKRAPAEQTYALK